MVSALITQAVDRLHARAGSTTRSRSTARCTVIRCERCGERYGLPEVGSPDRHRRGRGAALHHRRAAATPLRPEGTLWGEPLPRAAVERAWELAAEADAFLVLDSDLRTAPISLLPSVPLTRGAPLLVVGETPTQYDRYAQTVVRSESASVITAVADLIAPRRG